MSVFLVDFEPELVEEVVMEMTLISDIVGVIDVIFVRSD
jgi:hypothetical protein